MRRTPREEGAKWLEQAIEDLRWAKDLAERGARVSHRLLPGPADRGEGPQGVPHSIPDSIPARIFTRDAAGEAVRLADEMVTHVTDRLGRTEGGGG